MKPQDIAFMFAFAVLIAVRRPRLLAVAGLGSLLLAIPLFATWTFFTAERLTWYAAAFFAACILISLLRPHTVQ